VDGGHANTQTKGEIVAANSRFQDSNNRRKCLPGQLDLESSAASATKGRICKAVTGGNGSQRNSLTVGKKLKTLLCQLQTAFVS